MIMMFIIHNNVQNSYVANYTYNNEVNDNYQKANDIKSMKRIQGNEYNRNDNNMLVITMVMMISIIVIQSSNYNKVNDNHQKANDNDYKSN